jgi:hypothetical protein
MYAYCGNNPVNNIDSTGEDWWHWALGAAVVVACAVATVVTCGGFSAAVTAVCMVGSGITTMSTASTVAAAAFIGSASVYGASVFWAAASSSSVEEFNNQGNWGTVMATAGSAALNATGAYLSMRSNAQSARPTFNLDGAKDNKYVTKRGWTTDLINTAINNGPKGTSVNMANGAQCTVYCYPGTSNQYAVIENESRNLVQLSNFNDSGWIPDSRIQWDP